MPADVMELARRYEALVELRRPWDDAWKDLSGHFMPTRYRDQPLESTRNPKLLNGKLVDSTGILAMRDLAAGLQGGMTSPARPWFRLSLDDRELAESHGVRAWLDEVAERMRNVFHRSNFYNAIHTAYGELGTFGTAYMMELADYDSGFRFLPFTAGEYVLDINEALKVDVVFRKFAMTARQIVRMFGEVNTPDIVKEAGRKTRQGSGEGFTVVHAVYPRNDRDPKKLDKLNKPFVSVYWLDFSDRRTNAKPHVLREAGFDEFPGFGVRWDVTGNDVYGKSPAMDVLPDCRMLQQMATTTLKAIHKSIDPPMSVSTDLISVGLNMGPGGSNFVATQPGQPPVAATPILQVRPEIQGARLAINDVQNQIRAGLYNDLFRMLMGSDRRQITAREIAAREEEKLILIGPVLERLHDEMFIPLIDRTFNLMARLNMLPPFPPEIEGQPVKVEFVSLLAQAQKLVSTTAVDQVLAFTMNAAAAFPEVLDAVDVDNMIDEYSDYLGVPVNIIRPKADRETMRQARAQAQQQAAQQAQVQQGMAGLGEAAKMAQTLSQTPVGGNSALDVLTGGMGSMGL